MKKNQWNKKEIQQLLDQAIEARSFAYAPYSSFKVGAAIQSSDGRIYRGCNIENASYGLSICAERVALYHAWASGSRDLIAIAIVYDPVRKAIPCGACRQVLMEFNPTMILISGNLKGAYQLFHLDELLPHPFLPETVSSP